ncbi:MAG: hypothetical protein IKP40_12860 [Clostridia bacterium]|nr:hypothetical protein [Clostridia bacterium]
MKRMTALLLALALVSGLLPALAEEDAFAAALEARYVQPDISYKTEVRWWMAEGAHTDETLLEEIAAMHEAGFRGMELCEQVDDQVSDLDYGYGSDQWDHDLKLVLRTALEKGMTVSLTAGTNWATANIPGLDPQSQAASQIVLCIEEYLKPGKTRSGAIPMEKKAGAKKIPVAEGAVLIGVYALRQVSGNKASPITFDPESAVDLSGSLVTGEDGVRTLEWAVPDESSWRIFYYWQQGAEQTSRPAAEPAYCINYFDEAGVQALAAYWEAHILNDESLNALIREGDVQLFMDSLEIDLGTGITFWAQDMAEEFLARKGYDIRPWLFLTAGLPELAAWGLKDYGTYDLDGAADLRARLLNDLFDVQTQLYMERMLTPLRAWLHGWGIETRGQISYGRYIEISEPIMAVDYPEAENLNQNNQPDIYRLWSGGAKLQNKTLSAETGAVGGHYYTFQDHLMEAYTLYAAGYSRIIWHVWSAAFGPGETDNWPGYKVPGVVYHSFYTFGQGEPSSADYPLFNDHLGRIQQLLQEGVSRTDVGMPYVRYNQDLPHNGNQGDNWLLNHSEGLFPSTCLQDSGYTYDYFSPDFLTAQGVSFNPETGTVEQAGYRALVLWQDWLPLDGAETILDWARQGLKVVLVEGAASRTPYRDGGDEALAGVIAGLTALPNVRVAANADEVLPALADLGVTPYAGFTAPNHQLLTQTRRDGDTEYLYVYNYCDGSYKPWRTGGAEQDDHGDSITTEIVMDGTWIPYAIDAWSGRVTKLGLYRHEDGKTVFPITLDYGNAALYAFRACGADEEPHAVSADVPVRAAADGTLAAVVTAGGAHTVTLQDGREVALEADVPAAYDITGWDVTVTSFTPGDGRDSRTETLNGKTVTETVRQTIKTEIPLHLDTLVGWDQMPGVGGQVIGQAVYRASFDWDGAADGAYLDFGSLVESMRVTINGEAATGLSLTDPVLDITPWLREGENTIELVSSSNLSNLLGDSVPAGWYGYRTEKHSYGPQQAVIIPFVCAALSAP